MAQDLVTKSESEASAVAPALSKEAEIDDVMQFLQFSVKTDSSFAGTILFKFKGTDGKPQSSYAVEISDRRGMERRLDLVSM